MGIDATLGDECGIWEHLHSLREMKCLQGYSKTLKWVYKTLRLFPLAVAGFQSRRLQIESYG